jgi:hypothetical protein
MAYKNINIGVAADVSGLKTGINDAIKTLGKFGDEIESKIDEPAKKTESSFKTLSQAFRATAKDAQQIAMSQGTASAAFLEATQKAGRFKDELELVNNKIKAFSSDTPVLTSALGVGQGLAGGFAAAQGAMALFGDSSKEVEQALLKVQGAMALLQGLQAIGQLGDAMSAFAAVIKVQVIPALMTMQGAIIATGIGAVVVAVIALTQAASNYNDQIDREIDLKAQRAEQDKLWNAAVNKAAQAELKTEEFRVRAMKEGLDKQLASIELKRKTEIQAEKDILANSNKTYTDTKRFDDRLKLINQYYKQEGDIAVRESQKTKDKLKAIVETPEIKRQDSNFNKIETAVDLTKWGENLQAAKIPLTSFVNTARTEYQNFLDETGKFNEAVRTTLESGVENAFINMSASIGNSLATGANVMEGIGAVLLEAVGSMAIQLGQLAIQTGIAMKGIKMSFKNPYTAIAAGIALVALGSYVSSKAKSITSGGGGGGGNAPSPDNSTSNRTVFSGFTPANNSMVLTTRLIGQDLLMSVQKAGQQNTRVR